MALDLTSLNSTATAATTAATTKKRDQLDQADFLRPMATQLKNQDPLKPLDPTEFLTQLTQFSVVDGVQSMQGGLSELSNALRSSQALDGATLVGRSVFAPATRTTSSEPGASVRGAVDVPDGATGLRVAVLDASGQIVRSIDIEGASGLTDFVWDGKAADGTEAPAGAYSFQAIASVGGQRKPLDTLLAGRVDSVTIDTAGKSLLLNTPIGTLQLADVRRVM